MKLKRLLRSSIILAFFSTPVYAGGYIGASINYLNINDGYKYGSNYQPSFNFGYNLVAGDYVVGLSTNRLNPSIDKSASKNGVAYQTKSKVNADTISIGIKGRLTPSLFASNVQVDKRLYYQDTKVGSTTGAEFLKEWGGVGVDPIKNRKDITTLRISKEC